MATPVIPTYSPYDISDQISEFKDAYYGEDVRQGIVDLANKLNNELNNMSTHEFVTVDDTLTVQGAGADAKATGDALAGKADKDYAVIEDRAAIGPDCAATLFASAMGIGVEALSSIGQLAIGRYNVADSNQDYIFLVGNGNADNDRHNAAVIDTSGNAWFAGSAYVGGADLAHGSELATKAYADAIVQGFDSYPQDGSSNGVTSDGVYDATENAKGSVKDWVTSQGYATTSAMNTALSGKVNTSDVSNDITTDAASTTKVPSVKAIKDYADSLTPSGAVDSAMSDSSTNAVQNKVIKAYVDSAIATAIGNAIGGSY